VSEQLRILYNKELCYLYRSPSIARLVKSRTCSSDGVEGINAEFWWGNSLKKWILED